MSERGEDLIRCGDLSLKDGRLCLCRSNDDALNFAVSAALALRDVGDRSPRPVRVQASSGLAYLLEVLPLASSGSTQREAGALIVARPPQSKEALAAETSALIYRLTRAEAAVAGLMTIGLTPAIIAERQGVAVATVRSQINTVLQKANMHSQVEFIASLTARL